MLFPEYENCIILWYFAEVVEVLADALQIRRRLYSPYHGMICKELRKKN